MRFKKLGALILGALLTIGVAAGIGATVEKDRVKAAGETEYSYTFSSKIFAANGTQELDGVNWTLAGDGGYWGNDSAKGQQFGSGNKPYKSLTLTSDSFNNVSKIVINTSGASSVSASFVTKVGDTQVGTATITATATNYTFAPSSPLTGAVSFKYTQTSSKAIYIKSISVTYGGGSTENEPTLAVENSTFNCLNGVPSSAILTTANINNPVYSHSNLTTLTDTSITFSNNTITVTPGEITGKETVTITATSNDDSEVFATCDITIVVFNGKLYEAVTTYSELFENTKYYIANKPVESEGKYSGLILAEQQGNYRNGIQVDFLNNETTMSTFAISEAYISLETVDAANDIYNLKTSNNKYLISNDNNSYLKESETANSWTITLKSVSENTFAHLKQTNNSKNIGKYSSGDSFGAYVSEQSTILLRETFGNLNSISLHTQLSEEQKVFNEGDVFSAENLLINLNYETVTKTVEYDHRDFVISYLNEDKSSSDRQDCFGVSTKYLRITYKDAYLDIDVSVNAVEAPEIRNSTIALLNEEGANNKQLSRVSGYISNLQTSGDGYTYVNFDLIDGQGNSIRVEGACRSTNNPFTFEYGVYTYKKFANQINSLDPQNGDSVTLIGFVNTDGNFNSKVEQITYEAISNISVNLEKESYTTGTKVSELNLTINATYVVKGEQTDDDLNNYTFSLDAIRENAVEADQLVLSANDELVTVYMFSPYQICEADYFSFTVMIDSIRVTGIEITNTTSEIVEIARGSSWQVKYVVNPADATLSKEVEFTLNDTTKGASVDENGLVTVAADAVIKSIVTLKIQSVSETSVYAEVQIKIVWETLFIDVKVPAADNEFEKVTNASTLKAGDKITIVEESTCVVAGDITSAYLSKIDTTISDDKFIKPDDAVVFTLGGSSGSWTFSNDEGQLLGATAVKKVAWGSGTTTWSISITDGNAIIQNGNSDYGRFLYNVTSPRFTTYTSSTSATMLLPQIYRLKDSTDVEIQEQEISKTLVAFVDSIYDNGWLVCNTTNTSTIDVESIKGAYTMLSVSDKNILKNGVAVSNLVDPTANIVENFLATYDYLVNDPQKGVMENFLDREYETNNQELNDFGLVKDDSLFVLMLVAVVALTGFAFFYVSKRNKKEIEF